MRISGLQTFEVRATVRGARTVEEARRIADRDGLWEPLRQTPYSVTDVVDVKQLDAQPEEAGS